MTTTTMTTFGLGLNEASGNAAVGFKGGLQVDVDWAPDPILDKGVVDLGTGQYEATGSLNNIPASSVHVVGNLKSGTGNARSCVLLIICHNTPLDTKEISTTTSTETPRKPEE